MKLKKIFYHFFAIGITSAISACDKGSCTEPAPFVYKYNPGETGYGFTISDELDFYIEVERMKEIYGLNDLILSPELNEFYVDVSESKRDLMRCDASVTRVIGNAPTPPPAPAPLGGGGGMGGDNSGT